MTNIAELLKDAPKGMKLYSPLFGEVEFSKINSVNAVEVIVTCTDGTQGIERFHSDGTYISRCPGAECLLFPSKDCRTWEGWKAPKPHYDIANFHAGMPVLVRETSLNAWQYVLFSHCYIGGDGLTRFNAGLVGFTQCIPYEGNEHLLGTTDICDEQYINW